MSARSRIVTGAEDLVGAPFRHRGRTAAGLDCAGLVFYLMRMVTGSRTDFLDYSPAPDPGVVDRVALRVSVEIPGREAGPGDAVIMEHSGRAVHVGVLVPGAVVHADGLLGRVVRTPVGRVKIAKFFRLRGVAPWRS